MTEQEWLACADPEPMLEVLRNATDRKLRLFACACCRHTASFNEQQWKRLVEHAARWRSRVNEWLASRLGQRSLPNIKTHAEWVREGADLARRAAELAERAAEGLGDVAEVRALCPPDDREEMEYLYAGGADAARAAKSTAYVARNRARYAAGRPPAEPDYWREQSAQSDLLRDIFGNPFRPVAVESAWLTAGIVQLAQAIYDERAFDRLPALADALEQAGCTDGNILAHARKPGEHVRGCWVVDLLLGKV
ncbi:MAG: hypothetical protein ACJ8F7_06250 [Gemmataceae bacterium]